ncbi:MAG: energy transducer TonB, partial [Bacteroidia bacterium]
PPPPPEIEVVEDDEEIEEDQPEIEDTEIDQDTEIAEYEEEEEEPEETNEVFEIFDVSEKAAFPGGDEGLQRFIAENITYPPMALENDMQGTVNVMFVVDKQGRVKNIAILGGKKGFGLEDEAMRVIKMTSGRWSPAKQRDKAVNMRFRIPVKFQIF